MLFLGSRRSTRGRGACTLSSSLTTTAAPSVGNVSTGAVFVTVPPGNSGGITFDNFSFSGTVGTKYSKNGGAFTALSSGTSLTFADGDTIEMRGTGMTAGESWTFSLTDNTRSLVIGTYTITAS